MENGSNLTGAPLISEQFRIWALELSWLIFLARHINKKKCAPESGLPYKSMAHLAAMCLHHRLQVAPEAPAKLAPGPEPTRLAPGSHRVGILGAASLPICTTRGLWSCMCATSGWPNVPIWHATSLTDMRTIWGTAHRWLPSWPSGQTHFGAVYCAKGATH